MISTCLNCRLDTAKQQQSRQKKKFPSLPQMCTHNYTNMDKLIYIVYVMQRYQCRCIKQFTGTRGYLTKGGGGVGGLVTMPA